MTSLIWFLLFISIFTIAYNFFWDYINYVILEFAKITKFVFWFLPSDVLALFFWTILVLIFKKIFKIWQQNGF